jgi:hypothetical protein
MAPSALKEHGVSSYAGTKRRPVDPAAVFLLVALVGLAVFAVVWRVSHRSRPGT